MQAFVFSITKVVHGHSAAGVRRIACPGHRHVQVRAFGVEKVQLIVGGFLNVDGVTKLSAYIGVLDGNKKSFFFYEPNYGMAYFPDEQSFQRGLNDIFTTKDFARKYPTAGKDPNVLEFKISPHDDKALLNSGVDPRSLEDLYTVPL